MECFRTRVRFPPPPPFKNRQPVSPGSFSGTTGFLFPLVFKGVAPVLHLSGPVLHPPDSPSCSAFHSLFAPRFSVFSGRSPKLVRLGNPFYNKDLSRPAVFRKFRNTACGAKKHPNFRTKSPSQDLGSGINPDFPAGVLNTLRLLQGGFGTGSDRLAPRNTIRRQ